MSVNDWKLLWNNRTVDSSRMLSGDDKDLFLELKRASGFDTFPGQLDYDSFIQQLEQLEAEISVSGYYGKSLRSLFEIGCGSGANLWYFSQKGWRVGGVDYSASLLDCAKRVVVSDELYCEEAINMDTTTTYDVLLSNSVFSYFVNHQYARTVLEKMYSKVESVIALIDLHDLKKESAFVEYRKQTIDDYETKYRNYPKLFYSKDFFVEFADEHDMDVKFVKSRVKGYWNNDYVFNCYLFKNE